MEAAGVDVIQFEEPAFNVFLDEVADWGVAALERACKGLTVETKVHICFVYGIKANNSWKAPLGIQRRHYESYSRCCNAPTPIPSRWNPTIPTWSWCAARR